MIKEKKILIIIFILLPNLLFGFESNKPKSNYEIIDSLFQSYTDLFSGNQVLHKGETVKVEITSHPARWLLYDKLIRIIINDSCFISNDTTKNINHTYEININNVTVNYLNSKDFTDSLEREINVDISGVRRNDGKIEPLEEFKSKFSDRIGREDAESVNSKQYDFASSAIPMEEKTFFEEIVQPVILISSTIVAVVLLFTVRSN
ncbi:MAG: hypothetical protein EPN82_12510 [Bacteroidetes bacterium]|nr:MAG: hypothetical protein EPN82_12510 [Bacteroidota bacterium]